MPAPHIETSAPDEKPFPGVIDINATSEPCIRQAYLDHIGDAMSGDATFFSMFMEENTFKTLESVLDVQHHEAGQGKLRWIDDEFGLAQCAINDGSAGFLGVPQDCSHS